MYRKTVFLEKLQPKTRNIMKLFPYQSLLSTLQAWQKTFLQLLALPRDREMKKNIIKKFMIKFAKRKIQKI